MNPPSTLTGIAELIICNKIGGNFISFANVFCYNAISKSKAENKNNCTCHMYKAFPQYEF